MEFHWGGTKRYISHTVCQLHNLKHKNIPHSGKKKLNEPRECLFKWMQSRVCGTKVTPESAAQHTRIKFSRYVYGPLNQLLLRVYYFNILPNSCSQWWADKVYLQVSQERQFSK